MEFLNPYFLLTILLLITVIFVKESDFPFKNTADKIIIKGKIPKKIKFYLLLFSFVLFAVSLARPVINNGYTVIKAPVENIVIALDISKGMDSQDLYPNREKFAEDKIKKLLKFLNAQNVALILFDKHSYLISPPTNDYLSLIYLLKHTYLKNMRRSEYPDIYNMLKSSTNLVKNPKIVIFTWGGEGDLSKSADFIKKHDLKTYVYICGKKSSQYPPNPNLNKLGMTFNAQYSNENLKKLAKILNKAKQKDIKIKDKTELFYYPLGFGIAILFFVIFFPFRREK